MSTSIIRPLFPLVAVALTTGACTHHHADTAQTSGDVPVTTVAEPAPSSQPRTVSAAPAAVEPYLPSADQDTAATDGPDADNTARNIRDRRNEEVTPADQSSNPEDVAITRAIRHNLTQSSDLSTNAKNIKIITRGHQVVLRGPVKNADERALIDQLARGVVGVQSVDDRLEVQAH